MFNWLKNKAASKITSIHATEVDDWVKKLRSIDSDSIGMIVAMAAHLRNDWQREKHMDLLLPHLAIHQNTFIAMELVSRIKGLQKANNQTAASGYFPWLFTVRACLDLDLLANTRELWRQLERGFPYALSAADNFEEMFDVRLEIDRATEFPDGFTPDPL